MKYPLITLALFLSGNLFAQQRPVIENFTRKLENRDSVYAPFTSRATNPAGSSTWRPYPDEGPVRFPYQNRVRRTITMFQGERKF